MPCNGAVFIVEAMTEAIAFDTHRFVKRLTENGFTERQAETLADEHVALLNANLATKADIESIKADIATMKVDLASVEAGLKRDIEAVKAELQRDIEAVKAQLQRDIEAVKADLLKWLFGAMIAQGGLIVALVKLL